MVLLWQSMPGRVSLRGTPAPGPLSVPFEPLHPVLPLGRKLLSGSSPSLASFLPLSLHLGVFSAPCLRHLACDFCIVLLSSLVHPSLKIFLNYALLPYFSFCSGYWEFGPSFLIFSMFSLFSSVPSWQGI